MRRMPPIWLGLFLILYSVRCQNHLRPENSQMPGWMSARTTTKSTARNNCQYSCSEGGGCTVQFRGYILGKCDPSGLCVGTPKECEDCREVIECEKTSENKAKTRDPKTETKKHADYSAIREDLTILMKHSVEFWPADFGHYGPFFIRLAWHTSGSYRTSDGRGGADGARIRFNPEGSWADNTNLDKARALLWPIKQKYGEILSWGDLIILAGNTAVESMGGPILGFCGGRVDAEDGSESIQLGPSREQEMLMPCKGKGLCKSPLGTSTIGLIYVNPEGPMGIPNAISSAHDIREVFSRMAMNDSETVALIGGGHTFGKCHGPCKAGAGPSPQEDPERPWPGLCGSGKGKDAHTSGFELIFTTTPTSWNNEYFHNLIDLDWKLHRGPGNHHQWVPDVSTGTPPQATTAFGYKKETIGLLTSDVALKQNHQFRSLVRRFKEDQEAFDHAFKHAWYKLTTADMGPRSRCVNDDAPPSQSFQYPLPEPPAEPANFDQVKHRIVQAIHGNTELVGKFCRLAWQCSSSFRSTDYHGGCNGARLRFAPEKNWPAYTNIDKTLQYLKPIKEEFENLSWADLIVLAGNAALEEAGGNLLRFCGGRTDAKDGQGSEFMFPTIVGDISESVVGLKNYISGMGLSKREFAALNGVGYAVGDSQDCEGLFCRRNSYQGYKSVSSSLSNIFFLDLLSNSWQEYNIPSTGVTVYKAKGADLLMLRTDYMFSFDPELLAIAQDFASDNAMFLREAARAWTKLSNADRYDGPTGNTCNQ